MADRKLGKWTIAIVTCWVGGGLLIIGSVSSMFLFSRQITQYTSRFVIAGLLLGIVMLATGGTLHQIWLGQTRR
ncbi:hypothetical protein [Tautonia plasticadhaerens]|uniref:Uncharacterized protein n=1 Tax=Tautonia plasticadhaerens TaxID=2527974 RepID=A0A518HEN7_9BACT|nr:hypothetical protein [Tautonia plasticadhaerens]QDV39304.1 hypothetical protein ElP_72680 [Tautonia plasticadhaerens]